MMEWLKEHPVTESMDIEFLTFEVLRLQQISSRSNYNFLQWKEFQAQN